MDRRRLGSSDLTISRLGVGTAPIGSRRGEWRVSALAGRDDVLVFTKCGTLRRADGNDYMDLTPESIRRGCEEPPWPRRRQRDDPPSTRFVLSHPAVTGAIVGIRNEREDRESAAIG